MSEKQRQTEDERVGCFEDEDRVHQGDDDRTSITSVIGLYTRLVVGK